MKTIKYLTLLLLLSSLNLFAQKFYKDNLELLDNEKINPKFAQIVKLFIDSAKKAGFKPVINQTYRSFEEAKIISEKNKKIGIAGAAVSVHSFGLAVDIWLSNDMNEAFSFDPKDYKNNKENRFSYNKWLEFIKIGESFGLINGYLHNDTDHWELHPNWNKKDWISAKKIILPIYEKYPNLSELERLKIIWENTGL